MHLRGGSNPASFVLSASLHLSADRQDEIASQVGFSQQNVLFFQHKNSVFKKYFAFISTFLFRHEKCFTKKLKIFLDI